ncbi:MAG: hypothetical protein VZS44_05440 [Bacilli bacterium]|nr:hypothetical protein [Bacilli bacterium]
MNRNKRIVGAKLAVLATSSILSFYNCTGCVNSNRVNNEQNGYECNLEDSYILTDDNEEKFEMIIEDAASLDVLLTLALVVNDYRSYLEESYNNDDILNSCKKASTFDVDEYNMDDMEMFYDIFPSSPTDKQFSIYKSYSDKLDTMLRGNYYNNVFANCANFIKDGLNMEYDEENMYNICDTSLIDSLVRLVDSYDNANDAKEAINNLFFKDKKYIGRSVLLYDLVKSYKVFEQCINKSKNGYLNSDELDELEDSIFEVQDIYYEIGNIIMSKSENRNISGNKTKRLIIVNK